jgi:hypothetical protein
LEALRTFFPASHGGELPTTVRARRRAWIEAHGKPDGGRAPTANGGRPERAGGGRRCVGGQDAKRRLCPRLRHVLLARTFIHWKTLRFTKVLVNRARALWFTEPKPHKGLQGICVRETTARSVRRTTCQSTGEASVRPRIYPQTRGLLHKGETRGFTDVCPCSVQPAGR